MITYHIYFSIKIIAFKNAIENQIKVSFDNSIKLHTKQKKNFTKSKPKFYENMLKEKITFRENKIKIHDNAKFNKPKNRFIESAFQQKSHPTCVTH